MSDLNEIIEVPSGGCGLGGHGIDTYTLPCVYLAPDALYKCSHPNYLVGGDMNHLDAVGCNDRNIIFVRKLDYLNWKMTDGKT